MGGKPKAGKAVAVQIDNVMAMPLLGVSRLGECVIVRIEYFVLK